MYILRYCVTDIANHATFGNVNFKSQCSIYFMTYFYAPISTIVSRVPPSNPDFVPPKQHSAYNWHLSLLWVSVMYTFTPFTRYNRLSNGLSNRVVQLV